MMDKIRTLLEQLGSKELADQIIESIETHTKTVREESDKEYKTRLQRAKKVCVEEVNKYKDDLAKKTQIFFESRANAIERQIANQVAIKESAAETKLHKITALLEGMDVDGNQVDKAALQATMKQVRELQKQLRVVNEGRQVQSEKANRAHQIARKALERNQVLEESVQDLELAKSKLLNESDSPKEISKPDNSSGIDSDESKEITESKEEDQKSSLTEDKKGGKAKTTRATRDESVRRGKQESTTQRLSGYSVEAIASQID